MPCTQIGIVAEYAASRRLPVLKPGQITGNVRLERLITVSQCPAQIANAAQLVCTHRAASCGLAYKRAGAGAGYVPVLGPYKSFLV